MKEFPSFDDFEKALKNERVPSIDVDQLKECVYNKKLKVMRITPKRKFALTFAFITIFLLSTTAIAAISVFNGKMWTINNDNGEPILQYFEPAPHEDSEEDRLRSSKASHIRKRYEHIISKLENEVEYGEAIWFLSVDGYENGLNTYQIIKRDRLFSNIFELKKSTSTAFHSPDSVDFPFSYGTVEYEADPWKAEERRTFIDNLYNEAKKSGNTTISRKDKLSTEAQIITLNYISDDKGRIELTISKNDGIMGRWSTGRPEGMQFEKLDINGKEIIYSKKYNQYIMVDEKEGQSLLYEINTDTSKAKDKNIHDDILLMIEDIYNQ